MGAESTSNSNCQTQVVLNVYDLTPMNNYTYFFGLGVFHSGIEVHGREYAFGAHDFPASGVFEVEPKSCPGFIYRCSISLGHTDMSPSKFQAFIRNLASEYHGDTYHLISKNCNNFSDDMSWRLTRKRIPRWINRLARIGSLCSCLLPESLQATTVKQLPEYHERSVPEDCLSKTETADSTELDDDQDRRLLSPLVDVAFVTEDLTSENKVALK